MTAKDAERIIEKLYSAHSKESLLVQLEDLNDQIIQLVHKLQESAALSGLRLRQFYRHVEQGKEEYLLQMLDGRINSLQFYDIITQKLDHLLRTQFILIEDLKKSMQHKSDLKDAESFLVIFPELMKLHFGLMQLIKEEYISEINELESHFTRVSREQIPKDSVDIQLEHYRKIIEDFMSEILALIEPFSKLPEEEDATGTTELKAQKFEHVLSLYTMNSEREVFRKVFESKPFLHIVSLEEEASEAEDDVELF